MATLFTKIIEGEIPSYKVAENEEFYAFLDINPVSEGHTLVVPKEEVDYIFDIDDELLGKMMAFAKQVAKALQETVPCQKIALTVIGLEVPHAHIHLVPINKESDIYWGKKRNAPNSDALASLATKIQSNYNKLIKE